MMILVRFELRGLKLIVCTNPRITAHQDSSARTIGTKAALTPALFNQAFAYLFHVPCSKFHSTQEFSNVSNDAANLNFKTSIV